MTCLSTEHFNPLKYKNNVHKIKKIIVQHDIFVCTLHMQDELVMTATTLRLITYKNI